MGIGTFASITFNLNYLFYFLKRPKDLIMELANTNDFNVFCNGVESGFMARACTFARASVWSDLAESHNDSDIA